MSKTVSETVEETMRKMGYYDHPVTMDGNTHYVDEASPFAQIKKQINELPQELDNRLQDYLDNKAQVYVNVPQNNVQAYNQEVMNRINQGIQQPQGSYWNGVATGAVTGTGEGIIGGTERYLNTLSGGIYGDVFDRYPTRQNSLQEQASSAGVGKLNQLANDGVDWTARGMQATLLSKINKLIK